MDCMDFLKSCTDMQFDLAIVDPPYGININPNMGIKKGQKKRHDKINWDNEIPTKEYFNELFRVSKNQIIWGGNYFELPANKHFIFWDKKTPVGMSFSDGEYAWTSFNRAIRKIIFRNVFNDKIHPTQKPIYLYEWLLMNYAQPGDKILDTHLGSASIAIACHNLGFDLTGTELDADYFAAATKRLKEHQQQLVMF